MMHSMSTAPIRCGVLAVVLVLGIGAGRAAAAPGDAAKRVLDSRYQDVPVSAPSEMGGGGGDSGGGDYSVGGGGGALGTLLSWLLWGVLGIGAVVLVIYLIRAIANRQKDEKIELEEEAAIAEEKPQTEAELEAPLDEADLLAREGRYAEAIHLLLLRTFEELARADGRPALHLTAREILARIRLREGARDALTELVTVVENTWWGDDVPGELDWQRCRGAYDRFVAAYRAPAADAANREAA